MHQPITQETPLSLPPPLNVLPDMAPRWRDVDVDFDTAANHVVREHYADGESRDLPIAQSAEDHATQVVAALLAGPAEPGHIAGLSEVVELASLHLSDDGVIYVDLAAAQLTAPPVSGSRGELLAVYSMVNSIIANVPAWFKRWSI